MNLLLDKLRTRIDEIKLLPNPGSNPIAPPNWVFDKLISNKLLINQTEPGTEPLRALLERSIFCKWVKFLRNFHEKVPLRLFEERLSSVNWGFDDEQFWGMNSDELKLEIEVKALEMSKYSVFV